MTPGLTAFQLSFVASPIILTYGIANLMPSGMLPIIAITEALNFVDGLLSGGSDFLDINDFFASFTPLPGGTLIDQKFGEYPFANQSVAANAVIAQPLTISLRMVCPARGEAGYALKLATMTALQFTLAQHNALGGTYTVATPSAIYTNCLLANLRDTSNSSSAQAQNTYQWDFRRPLVTLQDVNQAQNNLMAKITSGIPTDGSWSGILPTVGNPLSLGASSLFPVASGPLASGVASPTAAVTPT